MWQSVCSEIPDNIYCDCYCYVFNTMNVVQRKTISQKVPIPHKVIIPHKVPILQKLAIFFLTLISFSYPSSSTLNPPETSKPQSFTTHLSNFHVHLTSNLKESILDIEKQLPVDRLPVGNLLESSVKFWLYTQTNILTPTRIIIGNSYLIDKSKAIKYIIHGWLQNSQTKWIQDMKDEYLIENDVNIILVDWKVAANKTFGRSASYSKQVGEFLANHIISSCINPEEVHVIGYGMGAHIAGFAGQLIKLETINQNIYRITGLDPLGPGFDVIGYGEDDRLDKSDAKIVDVTHTDSFVFGYHRSIGTVDFYPNGGHRPQPGCKENLYKYVSCSHIMSTMYFTESINSSIGNATQCISWNAYKKGLCDKQKKIIYGDSMPSEASGDFYFSVTI